jgi:hypothetical protein
VFENKGPSKFARAMLFLEGGIASTGKEFRGILGSGLVKRREIGRGELLL